MPVLEEFQRVLYIMLNSVIGALIGGISLNGFFV